MRNKSTIAAVKNALAKDVADRAVETPDGELSWRWSETVEVLDAAASKDIAILGGDMYGVEAGAFINVFPGCERFRLWDTEPPAANEEWSVYCLRTAEESRAKLTSLDELSGARHKEGPNWSVRVAPAFAVRDDLRLMIPRDKHDHFRAELAIGAGFPAIEPILPDLLECIQDMNWPVAQTLAPFLESIGLPLVPHLRFILGTDDGMWKYWTIGLISTSRELSWELREELSRIVTSPTADEIAEELSSRAAEVLEEHRITK